MCSLGGGGGGGDYGGLPVSTTDHEPPPPPCSRHGRRVSKAASPSSTAAGANGSTTTRADQGPDLRLSIDAEDDDDLMKGVAGADTPPPPPPPPPPPAPLLPLNEEVTYVDDEDAGTVVVDRDPFRWNEVVKVKFEDIFGEPDPEIFSVDSVWKLSNKIYRQTKSWCYRLLSILFAVPLAVSWGLFFSCQAFLRVWLCVPCLRASEVQLHCLRRLIETLLRTFVAPCFEAVGRCFYHLRLRVLQGSDGL